jgi:hypothetical protein
MERMVEALNFIGSGPLFFRHDPLGDSLQILEDLPAARASGQRAIPRMFMRAVKLQVEADFDDPCPRSQSLRPYFVTDPMSLNQVFQLNNGPFFGHRTASDLALSRHIDSLFQR